MAQVAFGASGASGAGTTSIGPTYPAGITAGQMLLLAIANKYPTNGPTTPSGWTLLGQYASGGLGVAAADSGDVYITVFYRIADGTETGTLTVTMTGCNSSLGVIQRFTKTGSAYWDIAITGGAFNAATTAWSVTGAGDPGITALDRVVVYSAQNTDAYVFSTEAISSTGVTYGGSSERLDASTSQGDDCHLVEWDVAVTSGTSSAAPVYTMTSSGNLAATNPIGASAIVRLREVGGPGTGSASGTSTVTAVGSSTAASAGASAGTGDATGVGASTAASTGASSGTCTSTAVGSSTASTDGLSAGVATATAVGSSTASTDGVIAGTSTSTAVGSSTASTDGTSAGVATPIGVGASTAAADGISAGTSTSTAAGTGLSIGAGSSAGTSTASSPDALGLGIGTGSADGTCTVDGHIVAISSATGAAAGTSRVTSYNGKHKRYHRATVHVRRSTT